MTKGPSLPFPEDERFVYWVASAVVAAIIGGLAYSWMAKNDPLGLKEL